VVGAVIERGRSPDAVKLPVRLSIALQSVERARFCLDDQGNQLPQTSSVEMITRMLQVLDVQPGNSVLEIGTGSGYSTALLAELSGPSGRIVSIDVDPEMTRRAARLLADTGYHNVLLVTADGRKVLLAHGPFDRLVAWAAATALPRAWREQTGPNGVLVVPRRVSGVSWVSRYRRTRRGSLVEDYRLAGGFIPLTARPFRPWEAGHV
jgi:protein-L-isoaspartate(D-aspartate) O-methyltransferase